MNSQASLNLLRQILTVLGGLFAGYGIGNVQQWGHVVDDIAVIVPALVSLGSILWSIWAHWRQVKVPEHTIVQTRNEGVMNARNAVKDGVLTLLAIGVVLALAAPAMAQKTPAIDLTAVLQKIHDDAQASLADANSHQDQIAAACYKAIADDTSAKLQAQAVTGGGLLLAFQKLRDLSRMNASPQGTGLILGCAPLVQDAKLNMLDFFTKIGAAALLKGVLVP